MAMWFNWSNMGKLPTANNVNVVNAIVEANYGAGIVLEAGYQVNLEGNVIEGNKGPGIVASGMYALTVSSNCTC